MFLLQNTFVFTHKPIHKKGPESLGKAWIYYRSRRKVIQICYQYFGISHYFLNIFYSTLSKIKLQLFISID